MNEIITALIVGGLSFLGVVITNNKAQAVMEVRIDELTREVREHNNFARRIPTLEERVNNLADRVDEYHK